MIQEVYLASDCRYGYRKITAEIIASGVVVNHKKILRIMKKMKISGLYCRKRCNTSIKEKKHKIYPYLLKDLIICRVNQVWATDITYIMVEGKFIYFVAIMDLYSRYIIAHSLSPYLDDGFCLYTLKEALKQGKPEIFNSDQGVQFNLYQFVGGNPVSGVDLFGLMPQKRDLYKTDFNDGQKTSLVVSQKKLGEMSSIPTKSHYSGRGKHAEASYITSERSKEGKLEDNNVIKENWKLTKSPCQKCTQEIIGYMMDRLEKQPSFNLSLAVENIYQGGATKLDENNKVMKVGRGSEAKEINATSLAAMQVMFPHALHVKYAQMYQNVENKANTKGRNTHPLYKQRQDHADDGYTKIHAKNLGLVVDPFKVLAGKIEEIANGQPGGDIESIRGAIESMVKSNDILKNLLQEKEDIMIDAWKSQGMTTVGSVKSTIKAILEKADNLIKYSIPANDNQASSSNKRKKRAPGG